MSDEDQSKDYLPSEDDQNVLESSDDSSSKEADSEKEDSKESFQGGSSQFWFQLVNIDDDKASVNSIQFNFKIQIQNTHRDKNKH